MEVPNDLWCGTLSHLEMSAVIAAPVAVPLTKMNIAVRQLVGISSEKEYRGAA